MINIVRDTGVSGYVGDGANRWPACHALDIGRLYRLALDNAPTGAQLYGAAEQGVTVREIAETHRTLPGHPGREHRGQAGRRPLQGFPIHHA